MRNRKALLAAASCGLATPVLADGMFAHYEIDTGFPSPQTVFAGAFTSQDTVDIGVAHTAASGERRLRLFAFNGGAWKRTLDATLRADAAFVDVARTGARDRIIIYGGGRFTWLDPQSATEAPLLPLATNYKADADHLPRVDVTRDVTGDGVDDLVLPDLHGFHVAVGQPDGSFAEATLLGPAEPFLDATSVWEAHNYRATGVTSWTVPWYQSRVHALDHNRDGRRDLAFWNGERFDVHHQTAQGRFAPAPVPFAVEVPFHSDGLYSLLFAFKDESVFSLVTGYKHKTDRTVLHSFADAPSREAPANVRCRRSACYSDLNGDGVADIATLTMSGRSVFSQRSRYAVHFGTATAQGIRFRPVPDTVITGQGVQNLQPHDVDGDGVVEVMARTVDFRVRKILRGLLPGGMVSHVDFYRLENGAYPAAPNARRAIRTPLVFGHPPTVLVGDVNGDGRSDLLLGRGRKKLDVYLGVPGRGLFAPRPRTVRVPLPPGEELSRLVDFNRDGKQDVLLRHPAEEGPHQLVVLMAR